MTDKYTYHFEVGAKFIYEGGQVSCVFMSNDSYGDCHDRIDAYNKKLRDEGKKLLFTEIFHTAMNTYIDVDYD